MSAIASFYVISKTNFEEYCKMADLVPYKSAPAGEEPRKLVRAVGQAEINSPAFRKRQEYYEKLFNFLQKNGKEPYIYNWSGYVLAELLEWLKEARNINLSEIQFMAAEGDDYYWIVFDESVRKKYLEQLNPANFKEQDVLNSFQHLLEQRRDAVMKEMAAKLTKEQMKMFAQMAQLNEEKFAERGKAMMEGIDILYKYMQLTDPQSVVMLHIG